MNTQYWEDKFNRWAHSPSQTEQDKAERAERMIRDAIASYAPLRTREIRVFAQGSYRNRTNVRADSDVDICVLSKAGFYGDYSLVPGVSNQTLGYCDAPYTLYNLKSDVEAALKAHFGAGAITRC
jgi:tRNA nucleotidyltransferase (CCA-adding enzyme)